MVLEHRRGDGKAKMKVLVSATESSMRSGVQMLSTHIKACDPSCLEAQAGSGFNKTLPQEPKWRAVDRSTCWPPSAAQVHTPTTIHFWTWQIRCRYLWWSRLSAVSNCLGSRFLLWTGEPTTWVQAISQRPFFLSTSLMRYPWKLGHSSVFPRNRKLFRFQALALGTRVPWTESFLEGMSLYTIYRYWEVALDLI